MAGSEVGTLHYDFSADSTDLQKGLQDASKSVSDLGDKLNSAGQKISAGLNTAAKNLAVVGVGLTAYAKSATSFLTDTVKSSKTLATQIGVTTTEASRLTAAFGRMGLAADQTQQMFGIFSKQIVASTTNSKANELAFQKLQIQIQQTQQSIKLTSDEITKNGDKSGALNLKLKDLNNTLATQKNALTASTDSFQKLGITTVDAQGQQKDFNTLLFEVADKFQTLPNGINKTAIAMDLFGRSGKDMIKVLNLGSDGIKDLEAQADKLGLTLTPGTIDKINKLVVSQKNLKEQTDALKISVGTTTAPVLTAFNTKLNDLLATTLNAPGPIHNVAAQFLAFGGPVAAASASITGFLGNLSSIGPMVERLALGLGVFALAVAAVGGGLFLLINHFGGLHNTLVAMQPVLTFITGIWATLRDIFIGFLPSLQAIWNSIQTNLLPALDHLWDSVTRLWNALNPALIDALKVMAVVIGLFLLGAIYGFVVALNILVDVFSFVASAISDVIGWIGNLIGWWGTLAVVQFRIVMDIINIFGQIPGFIGGVINSVVGWFDSLPARIGSALSTIGAIIAAPFKAAFNAISGLWNNSVGKLSFTAPSWVPGIGGKGFSMPKLPILDTGGLVTSPTIAALAMNNKPEAIVPLDKAGGLGSTYNIQKVELSTADAVKEFFNIDDRNNQLVGMGGSPLRT